MKINCTLIILLILINYTNQVPYDPDKALDILYYAKVAQCNGDNIKNWNCGAACDYYKDMQDVKVYQNSTFHTQGYSGYDPKFNNIVIGFRGSDGAINWILNFDFPFVNYDHCSNCKVHQGFYLDWKTLRIEVLQELAQLVQKHKNYSNIIVTGHSLGSAMATLAVLDVARLYGTVNQFYSFGSPRVGNKYFSKYFKTLVPYGNRVVHSHDIVPHVPMRTLFFRHVSTEIWYPEQNSTIYKICDNTGEDVSCSDSVPPLQWKPSDHDHYLGISCSC